MEALRRTCIEELRPTWDRWSYKYPFDEEEVKLYSPGHKQVIGDNCILDMFLKKTRSSTAILAYDFTGVPELNLHFSRAFCDAVNDHRLVEQEESFASTVRTFLCPDAKRGLKCCFRPLQPTARTGGYLDCRRKCLVMHAQSSLSPDVHANPQKSPPVPVRRPIRLLGGLFKGYIEHSATSLWIVLVNRM